MRTTFVVLAVCTLLGATAPISAAEDREFIATADGTALKLTITEPGGEPQGLTIGSSSALVQSSPSDACAGTACASSAAAIEPFGETATVVAKKTVQKDSAEGFTAPAEFEPVLDGALGTATVTANPAPAPRANGTATAGSLEVNVLDTLLDQGEIGQQLDGAVDELTESLTPVLDPLQENDPSGVLTEVEALIKELIAALDNNPLAVVEVGASTAEAQDFPKKDLTVATATADGAEIQLAPVDVLAPEGLFKIVVGESSATVQSDGTKATKSSKGSIVKLLIADLSTPKDGDYQEVDVATDQPEQCFGESPLLMCVIVGGTAESGEGAEAAATGAAVRIKAFADADDPGANNPLPGLTLAVAEATAGVNVAVEDATDERPDVIERDDPTSDPELPSTGGGLGLIGFAILGTGVFAVTRLRRR